MKKSLLLALAITALNLKAEMRYNPVTDALYSHPASPDINQLEYFALIKNILEIDKRVITISRGIRPSVQTFLSQYRFYLEEVGSPTALRLLNDLKHNVIYYADGSLCRYMFY